MSKQFTVPSTGTGNVYTITGNAVRWNHNGGGVVMMPDLVIEGNFRDGFWREVINPTEKKDEVVETITAQATPVADLKPKPIASDGGSSTYYDISLPQWLIARILERYEDGSGYIKTEELIEVAFNDDFDAGNAFKSLVRLWGAYNGAGKAGNSVSYEKKKIEYSVGKLAMRFERNKNGEVGK